MPPCGKSELRTPRCQCRACCMVCSAAWHSSLQLRFCPGRKTEGNGERQPVLSSEAEQCAMPNARSKAPDRALPRGRDEGRALVRHDDVLETLAAQTGSTISCFSDQKPRFYSERRNKICAVKAMHNEVCKRPLHSSTAITSNLNNTIWRWVPLSEGLTNVSSALLQLS